MSDQQHRHHHHHHSGGGEEDTAAMIEQLDLDAEVFGSYLSSVVGLVKDQAAGRSVRRILDLGCGTGNGALKLAEVFGDAEVIAVDSSPAMLARLRDKAGDRGLTDRVSTVETDLDGTWPPVGAVDVVWMSMALHHLADPEKALAEMYTAINPGGLLALAELTEPLRFLPESLGIDQPGLEERCHAAQAEFAAAEMPYLGADWGPLVAGAGFDVVVERRFELEFPSPLAASARQYACGYLKRSRSRAEAALGPDDLAALEALTSDDGPQSILRRADLEVRGARTLWIGAKGAHPSVR
jgi:SAM-dependent methyltransferase